MDKETFKLNIPEELNEMILKCFISHQFDVIDQLLDAIITIERNNHMNDPDKMPPKCQNCPYWEWAEYPYFCDCDKRYENNEIPNRSQSEEENY